MNSLNGASSTFPERFAQIKKDLSKGHEEAIIASWKELLEELATRTKVFAETGPEMIPQVELSALSSLSKEDIARIKRVGSVVIRNIVDDEEARSYKTDLEEYAKANPQVHGFPASHKQFFEIYWSSSQLKARSHPNVFKAGSWLNNLWSASPESIVDLNTNLSYADRFRIRKASKDPWNAHGPHIDGAGTERWQDNSLASTYGAILRGDWKSYDPYDITGRLTANTDMYDRPNQTSIFRSWQGWMAMNEIAPGNGTLRVFPDLLLQNSYIMLRPFFKPIDTSLAGDAYLAASNWKFDTSDPAIPGIYLLADGTFSGITPSDESHPHLRLDTAIVSIPRVQPGDMVYWHCDVIHSVERFHDGPEDSSVIYIPAVPLTPMNVRYLAKHRATFEKRIPPPDFPQGTIGGESGFKGQGKESDITSEEGRLSMGMVPFKVGPNATPGAQEAVRIANEVLGMA